MSISAVIVNYHTAFLLPPLLEILEKEKLVEQIIVADNSLELSNLKAEICSDKLEIISNEQNIGFAAAVNKAIKWVNKEWILVINPDVRPVGDCIQKLLKGAKDSSSPLVGPRFYWDEDRLFRLPPATGSCWWQEIALQCAQKSKLDAELLSFYWIIRHDRFWQAELPFWEPFLSGACLLIKKDWLAFPSGQLFDQRFFLYFEDTDLCAQALLQDIKPLCIPQAEAIHFWNQAPEPKQSKAQRMLCSSRQFWEKYYQSEPNLEQLSHLPDSLPSVVNIGKVKDPPAFKIDASDYQGPLFFEFGVSVLFIPFAQAKMHSNPFHFPEAIWDKLAPGRYFSRVRSPNWGTCLIWQWEKL